MWLKFLIYLFLVALFVYYVSAMLWYVCPKLSPVGDVKFGRALIPFYYWVKKTPVKGSKTEKKKN